MCLLLLASITSVSPHSTSLGWVGAHHAAAVQHPPRPRPSSSWSLLSLRPAAPTSCVHELHAPCWYGCSMALPILGASSVIVRVTPHLYCRQRASSCQSPIFLTPLSCERAPGPMLPHSTLSPLVMPAAPWPSPHMHSHAAVAFPDAVRSLALLLPLLWGSTSMALPSRVRARSASA